MSARTVLLTKWFDELSLGQAVLSVAVHVNALDATVETQPRFIAQTGRLIFFGAWSMLFAGLFMAYAFVRSTTAIWPPADVPLLDVRLPLLSTGWAVASSAVLWFANRRRDKAALTAMAWLFGLLFLGCQIFAARQLRRSGLTPSSGGAYGTVLYGLFAAHALHLVPGLVALPVMLLKKVAQRTRQFWFAYWHFITVVWCLLFVALFGV